MISEMHFLCLNVGEVLRTSGGAVLLQETFILEETRKIEGVRAAVEARAGGMFVF